MPSLCDCGQYPIYPGNDECRVCDGSYRLTEDERKRAIYSLPKPKAVALAIMCAKEVLPLCQSNYNSPRAIQAAKNWLNTPTDRNSRAAMRAAQYPYSHPNGTGYAAATLYAIDAALETANAANTLLGIDAAYRAAVYAASAADIVSTYFALGRATHYAAATYDAGADYIYEKVDRWLYEN